MGILDFLKRKPEATATVARERLRIIVAQERSTRGAPDYLPMMRNELLEVIKKYVHVDLDAIDPAIEALADSCDGVPPVVADEDGHVVDEAEFAHGAHGSECGHGR